MVAFFLVSLVVALLFPFLAIGTGACVFESSYDKERKAEEAKRERISDLRSSIDYCKDMNWDSTLYEAELESLLKK